MSLPDPPPPPPTPEWLQSEQAGRPFAVCSHCDSSLDASGSLYHVMKEWRDGEPVAEFAVCFPCLEQLLSEFSEESLARMQAALASQAGAQLSSISAEWFAASQGFIGDDPEIQTRPESCHGCGKLLGVDADQVLLALCRDGRPIARAIARCKTCDAGPDLELSQATRERYEDFMDTVLPGVPAQMDLLFGVLGS